MKCEADDLDLLSHSLSIKVEYYGSFEYTLKWKRPMSPLRSPQTSKGSKKRVQKSPAPNKEVTQSQPRSKTQTRWLREADACTVDTNDGKYCDMLDLISSTEEEDVEVVNNEPDKSDEDSSSDCCSIASGPSILHHATPKKPKSSQGLCSACCQVYWRAKKAKAPIKNKLLDNDPNSLTCDQWVLIRKRTPRMLLDARRKFLCNVKFIKANSRQRRPAGAGESSACSRPHVFLQRNLKCVKLVEKKKAKKNRGRKRKRSDSRDCRVAKQQHLKSNSHRQGKVPTCDDDKSNSCFNSCTKSGRRSSSKVSDRADPGLTAEPIPSSVAMETTRPAKPTEVSAKQKTPKQTSRFRELLVQLQGNTSNIVREKR